MAGSLGLFTPNGYFVLMLVTQRRGGILINIKEPGCDHSDSTILGPF